MKKGVYVSYIVRIWSLLGVYSIYTVDIQLIYDWDTPGIHVIYGRYTNFLVYQIRRK